MLKQEILINCQMHQKIQHISNPIKTQEKKEIIPLQNSAENLFIYQLESKVLELQKKTDQQSFQIESLTSEVEFYMEMCESQKKKLQKSNAETLKEEYEENLLILEQEKKKIQEMIVALSEEYATVEMEEANRLKEARAENDLINANVEKALNKKELLLREINAEDVRCNSLRVHAEKQEDRLDELRNIERKWYIATREIHK